MEFLLYLKRVLGDALGNLFVWVLGPIWGLVCDWYLSGELWAMPMVWVTIFWALNWIIGSGLALTKSAPLPGQPDERWQPRKSVRSIGKLCVWLIALGMAWGLRKSGITGGWLPAGTLDVAVLLTEFIYLLRNLGRLARYLGNDSQGNILAMVADTADEYLHTRTTTTATVDADKTIHVVEDKITTTTHTCPALEEWQAKQGDCKP